MELRKFNKTENANLNDKSDLLQKEFDELKNFKELDVKSLIEEIKEIKIDDNIHKGHRSRLKSQFLEHGFDVLTDIQKLELLLFFAIPQKDTNPIAHELLGRFGSLREVMCATKHELMNVPGVKENSALLIKLVNSFTNYCHKPVGEKDMNTTAACIEYANSLFHGVDVEQFYVVCLNKSGKAKKFTLISSGTSDQVPVEIRDITRIAIENKVNRIMLCHNHPYGVAKPSDEDIRLTFAIICSCILNGIDVVDHVIVGTDTTISMHEAHMMNKLRKKAVESVLPKNKQELFLSSLDNSYIRSKDVKLDF